MSSSQPRSKKPTKPVSPAGPPLRLPEGDLQEIQPEYLLLDPQNLRLLEASDGLSQTPVDLIGQPSIQAQVWQQLMNNPLFDVSPLVQSIEHNGFLKHERLIVAAYDGDRFLVLEGNRRLTAVKALLQRPEKELAAFSSEVRNSLQTLPCFVLRGSAVSGDQAKLDQFRRASEIYIGMRHLMGVKEWQPASRYEFVKRLVDEKWTIEQVAERFGRKVAEVQRDLKAQTLFHDFRTFEIKRKSSHVVTYNAFAEAARAPAVMKWLGWSNANQRVEDKESEGAFFGYLIHKLKANPPASSGAEDDAPAESAESTVRKLHAMLKLDDEDVAGALGDKQFDVAEMLYEDRKEGTFAKRLQSFIRALKRTTVTDLEHNSEQNKELLTELQKQSAKLLRTIEGVSTT